MSYPDINEGDTVVLLDGSLYKMATIAKVTAPPTDKMVMLASYQKGRGFGHPSRRARGVVLGKLDLKPGMSMDAVCDMFDAAKKREQAAIRDARSLFESQVKGVVA
jgi:hypothetical protein